MLEVCSMNLTLPLKVKAVLSRCVFPSQSSIVSNKKRKLFSGAVYRCSLYTIVRKKFFRTLISTPRIKAISYYYFKAIVALFL